MTGSSCLVSLNNLYSACFQTDGNFVVYQSNTPGSFSTNNVALRSSNTCNNCGSTTFAGKGYSLHFSSDGNVYIKDYAGVVACTSITNTKGTTSTAMMIMQDDGNLVIYKDSTKTAEVFCTKMCTNSGINFEGYSPCYKNSDAVSPYENRDAVGAGFCRNNVFRNYEGVEPEGQVDCGSSAYKFRCKDTSGSEWSPCYRDEDAQAMGLANRDAAGDKLCRDHGYDGTDSSKDCGNWYYQFHCTQHWSPCYRDEDATAIGLANRDAIGDKWCKDHGYDGKDGTYSGCGNWYFKFRWFY